MLDNEMESIEDAIKHLEEQRGVFKEHMVRLENVLKRV